MKTNTKGILKIFAFFYLIPAGILMLLTALDAGFRYAYYAYYAFPEWLVPIPDALCRFGVLAAAFLLFGVSGYFLFFGKKAWRIIVPLFSILWAPIMPMLMYVVRHFAYGSTSGDADMMVMYHEDVATAVLLFFYLAIVVAVLLLELFAYRVILKEKPQNTGKVISPRHPMGFGFLLYFAAAVVLSTVQFFTVGEFSADNILGILMEYVINVSGFFVACFAEYHVTHLMAGKESAPVNGKNEKSA